jgi:hypothetical protein
MSYDVQMVNDQEGQIRIFYARHINEEDINCTGHSTFEGDNLVVNDLDMPLIIKGSFYSKERNSSLFIDNDEYSKESNFYEMKME